jgi:hypothetical protein
MDPVGRPIVKRLMSQPGIDGILQFDHRQVIGFGQVANGQAILIQPAAKAIGQVRLSLAQLMVGRAALLRRRLAQ